MNPKEIALVVASKVKLQKVSLATGWPRYSVVGGYYQIFKKYARFLEHNFCFVIDAVSSSIAREQNTCLIIQMKIIPFMGEDRQP